MGNMNLDDVLSKRNEINDTLLSVIDHATNAWGVKVLRVELKDIVPPQDMVRTMARQMTAERERRAVILEAEGVRQAQITRAEGEKQAAILSAEGRREAAFRDAEARERSAEAEAKATEVVTGGDRQRWLAGDQLLPRPEVCRSAARHGRLEQQQGVLPAGRGDRPDGHAGRHRRAGQGGPGARRGRHGGAADVAPSGRVAPL